MEIFDELRGVEVDLNFTHLHLHTSYSFLDGYNDAKRAAKRAKELGMKAMAITDHNHVGGVIDFQQACIKEGIKPILGCCMPWQLIYTTKGPKQIKDIKPGDKVLTHTGTYKKVLRHWDKDFDGTIYGIDSWNSNQVWLTDEHPVYVKHYKKTGETYKDFSSNLEWVRADEIDTSKKNNMRLGEERKRTWEYYSVLPKQKINKETRSILLSQYLFYNNYNNKNYNYILKDGYIQKKEKENKYDSLENLKPIRNKIMLTEDVMKLFGYFIAEGSYDKCKDKRTGIRFTFNMNETEYHKDVISSLYNIFNVTCETYERQEKNTTEIYCSSRIIADFFYELFGEYSDKKVFPIWFINLDLNLQRAFLTGIENGDGKITDKEVSIKMTSSYVIRMLKLILVNLGYASKITETKENKKLTAYTIRYTKDKESKKYYHEDDNYIYMPIKNVEQKHYKGKVYNFEVEEDNSYVTDIILHNCEMYWTWDTNILSMPKEDRNQWAIERAKASGFDIEAAIHRIENPISEKTGKPLKPKKISKTELNTLIEPYEYDTKQYHIILLAINQTGWGNLVKLQSEAAEKCTFNGRYCCDDEMLARHSEGLIMATACIGNAVPTLINQGFHKEAEEQIDRWHAIFGDRFYIEIQPLNIPEQRMANFILLQHAANKGIKVIATTDVHYTLKEDHDDHDTLLCIGTGKKKSDVERLRYSNDYWIKSYDEMIETFEEQAESMTETFEELFDQDSYMETVKIALENTNKIADMVEDIKLGSSVNLFPRIQIPFGMTPEGYLTMTCFQNLYKYKNANPEIDTRIYEKRLNDELKVINTKGFAPYILVVQDYIEWANKNGCPTGPGRGSGAGSLVLFLLGITKIIDPIKYNLLFFRFLTMDRSAPPDWKQVA